MFVVVFFTGLLIYLLFCFVKHFLDRIFYGVPHEPKFVHSFNPFIGFGGELVKDPIGFISSLYQRYGKTFVIQITTKRYVYLFDEQTYLTKVLKSNDLSIDEFLTDLMIRGLDVSRQSTSNETIQRIQMQQYHQYLTGELLETLNQNIHDALIESMRLDEQNQNRSTKNFFDVFGERLLFAGTEGLFGREFVLKQRKVNPNFFRLFQDFDHAYKLSVLNVPFRTFFYRETFANRNEFIRCFSSLTLNNDESRLIYERENLFRSNEFKDLFSEYDIAAHHASFLWAAVANTAPLCCWVVVDLFLHSEALRAVRNELDEHRTETTKIYERDFLNKFKILESCIYETMRRTSNSISTRQALRNTTIECTDKSKVGLRKGDMLIYPAFLKHFDPILFGPNPFQYQYDRFVKKSNQSKIPSVMLFGCGPHMCPGRYLAINEIKMLVILIIEHMEIEFIRMSDEDQQSFRNRLPYDYSKFLSSGGPKHGFEEKFDIKYSYRNL